LNLPLLALLVASNYSFCQEKKTNYGKTPDEIFPYSRFQKAYKYHFLEPIGFYGAGREKKAPSGLKEIRIGFLGPIEGSMLVDLGKQMLQGAMFAIEEANDKGGYKGIPFKLMIHNDAGLWGAAANEIVKMDDEGVWAWLGSIDDIVSHVAIRATLKLEIPLVCTGDPDPTFTETNIPWVVRVISVRSKNIRHLSKSFFISCLKSFQMRIIGIRIILACCNDSFSNISCNFKELRIYRSVGTIYRLVKSQGAHLFKYQSCFSGISPDQDSVR
jgi:hypothetical protein